MKEIHYTLHTDKIPIPLHGTFEYAGTLDINAVRTPLNRAAKQKWGCAEGNSYGLKFDLKHDVQKVEVYYYDQNGKEIAI